MTHPATAPPPPEAVGPLIRGLAVLRAVVAAEEPSTPGALVRATGLARSTVDRVLGTLEHLDHLRVEGSGVLLAPRLMELGNAYLAACRLPDLLGPLVDRLADEFDESVSLAVPDQDRARFVCQATRRRTMSVAFRIGDALPAECGAPGALFAADWGPEDWDLWRRRRRADPHYATFPLIPPGAAGADSLAERVAAARRAGWSEDDQLVEPGLVAVAMPVRDPAGRVACAASVVSHTSRHTVASLRRTFLPRLRRAVADLERALAAPPAAPGPAPDHPSAAARARAAKQELGPGFVESLARGLSVLAAFDTLATSSEGPDDAGAGWSLSALAETTGLPRATVRRSLITLRHLGYVAARDGLFRPRPRVLELGFARLSGLTLPDIARPHLVSLVGRVGDSASMSVLVGDDIQYAARVPTVRIMSVDITLGTRFPAYATSMGRVLLAGLPPEERAERLRRAPLTPLTPRTVTDPVRLAALLDRVAEQGYALVNEELEEGLRSLAVPVRDRSGRVVAALNVSMHASRRTAARAVAEVLGPLREAAAAVESELRVAGRYARVRPT